MDAIIITDQPPFVNDGVGDYSYNLMNCLKNDNFIIETFCKKSNNSVPASYSFNITSWGVIGLISLFREIRKKKPKWILFQYVPYAYSKIGIPILIPFFLLIVRISGTKIHANFHEVSIRLWNGKVSGIVRSICQRFIAYLISLFANSIQTSNKYYASLLFPFKANVLAIPSNFEIFFDTKKFIRNAVAVDDDRIIVSNANRCDAFFFESICRIFESNSNFKLKIIGRATSSDLLFIEAQLKTHGLTNKVELSVNIPADEYLKIFSEADTYIQLDSVDKKGRGGVSSKSGAIATAFMMGIPIVTTNGDLTDGDLFRQNDTVLLIPVNNSKLAVDAVSQIMNDERLRSKLIQNGKKLYRTRFSWTYTCNHIKTVIVAS